MKDFLFKNKKFDLFIFLTIFLVLILCKNTNFFKNLYVIFYKDHDIRQYEIAYDFCEYTGNGYIFYVKKKFELKKSPIIKNFYKIPNQSWIFSDPFNRIDEKKMIVLNKINNKENFKINSKKYKILDNFENNCFLLEKI